MASHSFVTSRDGPAVFLAYGLGRVLEGAQSHLPKPLSCVNFLLCGHHRALEHPLRSMVKSCVLADGQVVDATQRYQTTPDSRAIVRRLTAWESCSANSLMILSASHDPGAGRILTERIPSAPMIRSASAHVPSSKTAVATPPGFWKISTKRLFS